jgi:hypothetical protein
MTEKDKIIHACKHTRLDGRVALDQHDVPALWKSADFRKYYVSCFPEKHENPEENEKPKEDENPEEKKKPEETSETDELSEEDVGPGEHEVPIENVDKKKTKKHFDDYDL